MSCAEGEYPRAEELILVRQQARQNIGVLSEAGVKLVTRDAAGCSAQVKEYGGLLSEDSLYRRGQSDLQPTAAM
jgi:hypothetical protein